MLYEQSVFFESHISLTLDQKKAFMDTVLYKQLPNTHSENVKKYKGKRKKQIQEKLLTVVDKKGIQTGGYSQKA